MGNDLLALARSVLEKSGRWDSSGTPPEIPTQEAPSGGTPKCSITQGESPTVPMSPTIPRGTAGHARDSGTAVGTLAGQPPYPAALTALKSGCPQAVDYERWQRAIYDADAFLASWGEQAVALGWTARELLGLADVPDKPGPNYQRLSRYDQMGLVWMLQGRRVVAMTKDTAKIKTATGTVSFYRLRGEEPRVNRGHHGTVKAVP